MVLVEVTIPSLGRCYDFEMEETVSVEVLIRELIVSVTQREHCNYHEENGQTLSLYSQEQKRRLPAKATLQQCGILNGQRLILV